NFTLLSDATNLAASEREPKGIVHSFSSPTGDNSFFVESNQATIENLKRHFGANAISRDGINELEAISQLCEVAGYGYGQVRLDISVVRGLEYYPGPVFEADLLSPIADERGQPIRLGSVVSGGRYDGLVERFTGEKVPATGISIGVSRLLYGLKTLGTLPA